MGGGLHMKEKGFLVFLSKELKLNSLGECGCDVEHPPHTQTKRITLGMRLRIKPS